jgi:protein O-mannosyl-transferase
VKINVRAFLAPMALCATALVVYAGAFQGDFQYDDSLTILENPHLSDWHTFIGHLDHMVRPVLYATFLVDRSLYGFEPAGYHALNLLLHVGSTILVCEILRRAVEEGSTIPFWTALIFAIHPITTETVTYISGRASGLMALFYLFALFLYVRAWDMPPSRRPLAMLAALGAWILSIGSKETAVTLPLILLLWDVVVRRVSGASLRNAMLAQVPFWIVLVLAGGWAWSHPRYNALAQFSLTIRPFRDNVLSQLHVIAYSVYLLFTPWNQNFDHDLTGQHLAAQWPLPLELLFILGLVAASIFFARRLALVSFGLAWFFIQILPTSLIPRNDILSERNLYVPAIGLLLASVASASYAKQWMTRKNQRPAVVQLGSAGLATGLALMLSFFTYERNLLYQDRLLLWSDAVQKSPNKARPHNNLGYAYALHGDWDRAIDEFRTAARLDPDFFLAQQNLRDAYLRHVGRP